MSYSQDLRKLSGTSRYFSVFYPLNPSYQLSITHESPEVAAVYVGANEYRSYPHTAPLERKKLCIPFL